MTAPRRSVAPLKPVRTYRRSMRHWWAHERPAYRRYLLRELTCLAVGYYALLVLAALACLLAGEAAFTRLMAALRSPPWVLLNLLATAGMAYHAITWFQVMPKTMPFIYLGQRRVPDAALVRGGLAALALATLAVFLAFACTQP
ncbi:MAG: fumarate reductase subunit C [Pseudomonadota bacterium]|nr:fumarate reductase subunit C [Pseudomonadota bacterium]